MSCLTPRPALFRSRVLWLHYMLATVSDDAHFDMQTFVMRRTGGKYNPTASHIGVTASWPWCNTAGCIGGHIIMLGYTAEQRGSAEFHHRGFSQIAAEWLGLDNSDEAARITGSLFSPGPQLHHINRQQAIAVVKKLYEDGVLWWRAVNGMEYFGYGNYDLSWDRGAAMPVEWRAEPDTVVRDLFALRDRIRKAYWDGRGEQPYRATLHNDVPVCLLTAAGAVRRDPEHYGYGEDLRDAMRAATPPNMNFVSISDSGLDNALDLVDKSILTRLGVIPALRDTGEPVPE